MDLEEEQQNTLMGCDLPCLSESLDSAFLPPLGGLAEQFREVGGTPATLRSASVSFVVGAGP